MDRERPDRAYRHTTTETERSYLLERAKEASTIYKLGSLLQQAVLAAREAKNEGRDAEADKYFTIKTHILILALGKSSQGTPGLKVMNIRRVKKDGQEVSRLQFIFSGEGAGIIKTDATFGQLKLVKPDLMIDFTTSGLCLEK